MCNQCSNLTEEERRDTQVGYDRHLSNHREVTQLKNAYKDRCTQDSHFITFIFDFVEVQAMLKLHAAIWYYKRKLCTYDLGWYELGPTKATYNVEIVSCVYGPMQEAASRCVKTVALF
ncbi:hypothetical protein PoB_006737100 [Plakobranchus ocellatus]|uniref:SCP domain-containing protein n=1 Tax=Plakobranchus ocellatus TaxID=259542 RepID=A0AAV4D9W5_9GAST|nr:hypothetical protein PoB_006737100 [Plakobranchus ocellatus]